MARIIDKRPMTVGPRAVDEYLEHLEKHERARTNFRRSLQKLKGDFLRSLATKYTPRTVQKHQFILGCFTDLPRSCQYPSVNSQLAPEVGVTLRLPERGIRQRWEATGAPTSGAGTIGAGKVSAPWLIGIVLAQKR